MFCHLPRDSQRSGACASVTRKPAACWRSQLARRTTVLHRRREASRRCSALSYRIGQPQPAWHDAHARQARVFRHLPRDSQRSVALVRVPRECRLRVGGHNSHVAPRSCTEGERPHAGAVSICSVQAGRNQRSTARTRGKPACFATSRETASTVALVRVPREPWLRVGGHSSHVAPRSRTEGERLSAGAVPPYSARTDHSQRSTARARGKLACLPPRERQPAQWRLRVGHANVGCVLEVTARTSHHGLAKRKEASCQCSTLPYSVGRSQPARHGARARQARVFCHLPRDSKRSGACSRAT